MYAELESLTKDPLTVFTYALKAPESKRQYPKRFKVFLDYLKIKGDLNTQAKKFLFKARYDPKWAQDSNNIDDIAEEEDAFGSSVSSSDFNGDGIADLAVGVPSEDVGSIQDAGGVEVIYGSSSGLSATSPLVDKFWTQDSTSIKDLSEEVDRFGKSLG